MDRERAITRILLTIGITTAALSIIFSSVRDRASAYDYIEICEEIGSEHYICPELLEAIIEYNPEDGMRVGLMHLDPVVQKDRMKKLNVTNLNDAESNILVGTDYLLDLFEEYEDPYKVISVFLNVPESDEMTVQSTIERSHELEKAHGKVIE